ncbi:MAG: LysR family transcriptional regulator, partial [Pseudomonas sp.]|nr:LysR family transcriptional regulator [Pseudomonas sp.]
PIPGLEKRLQLIWRKPPGNLHPPGFVRHLLADCCLS